MELSPHLYHRFVRQGWITKQYIHNVLQSYFDFDNKAVLDFGSGTGCNCSLVSPDKYLGLDTDQRRIKFANRMYPGYRFDCLQGNHLPVASKSLDRILIVAVLHHIPAKELHGFLEEFRRVLKPHGKIHIMEPCFFRNAHLSNWVMASFDKGKYILSEDGYLNLFKMHRYEIEVHHRFKKLGLYNELLFSAEPKY